MSSKRGPRALGSARSNNAAATKVDMSSIQALSLQAAREKNAVLAKRARKKPWKCPACEVDNQPGKKCRMCPFNWEDPGKVTSHPMEETPFGFNRVENKKKNKKKNKQSAKDSSQPNSASTSPQKPTVTIDLNASDFVAATSVQLEKEQAEKERRQKEQEQRAAQQKAEQEQAAAFRKIRDELHLTYKIERCEHRSDVACPSGIWCLKYHPEAERRRDPGKFKYSADPCPSTHADGYWYAASSCEKGDMCSMCHTELERLYHPQLYRLTLCSHFTEKKECGWRHLCSAAHGVDDMRDLSASDAEIKTQSAQSNRQVSKLSQKSINKSSDNEKKSDDYLLVSNGGSSLEVPEVKALRAELDRLREEHAQLQDELATKEQNLVQKVVAHMTQQDNARKARFDAERKNLQKCLDDEEREHTKLSDRVVCAICCDRDRNAAVVPCGHTFCQTCISRRDDRTCMLCNQKWFHVQPLHL